MNRTIPLSARPVVSLTMMDAMPSSSLPPAVAGGDSMGEAMPLRERPERLKLVLLVEDEDEDDNSASIESGTVADNMTYTAPISDFELRFLDCGDEDIDDLNDCTVMASGPLASGTANSSDGFLQMTFTYDDVDTDGMISAGDTLSLNDTMGLHVGIYDLWASEYTNDSKAVGPSLPGFGSLLATISLLGAAFLLPRRDD